MVKWYKDMGILKCFKEEGGKGMKSSIRQRLGYFLVSCLIVISFASDANESNESKVAFLIGKLQNSTSFKVRLKAAIMLGRISDIQAIDPLCDAFGDDNYIVRGAAARALGNLGYPKAKRAVERLFELFAVEEEPFVRKEVAKALGKLIGKDSLQDFFRAMSDQDERIRLATVRMLVSVEDTRAKEVIVNAIGDEVEAVRKEAAQAVLKYPIEEAGRLLVKVFNNRGNPRTQVAAVKLAGELEFDGLINALSQLLVRDDLVPDVKIAASQVIARKKHKINLPEIIQQSFSQDRKVQDRAIYLLGIHGGGQAVSTLIDLLGSKDEFVRRSAVNALHDAGDQRAIPILERLLNTEKNPRAKNSIQRTIKRLKSN